MSYTLGTARAEQKGARYAYTYFVSQQHTCEGKVYWSQLNGQGGGFPTRRTAEAYLRQVRGQEGMWSASLKVVCRRTLRAEGADVRTPRTPKYSYVYVVQGNYGVHGWEDLGEHTTRRAARAELRTYNENEVGVAHRVIHRRVLNAQPTS